MKRFWWLFLLGCYLLFPAALGQAAAPWPTPTDWLAVTDNNWNPIRDATRDQNPDALDLSSGGLSGAVGSWDSLYMFYSSAYQTLYLRMLLSDDPDNLSGGNAPFRQYVWAVFLDSTGDGYTDWSVQVNGMAQGGDAVETKYNAAPGLDQEVDVVNQSYSAWPADGYTRVSFAGYDAGAKEMYYLDWQVPLSALSSVDPGAPPPVSESSSIRLFYGTSASDSVLNKDLMFEPFDYSSTGCISLGGISDGRYGILVETRNPTPPNNGGIWSRGETVLVHGCGWPYSSLTLNVRILSPDASTVVWFGTVPSAAGKVDPSPTWPIPCSAAAGVYYIQVEDPFNPGVYYIYDRFTIMAPEITITKLVSPDTVNSGEKVNYTTEVTNTGNATADVTQLVDVLPGPFSYVSGSTVIDGASAPDPSVNGDILTWPHSWVITPSSSFTVSFKAKAGTQQGIFSNNITIYGTNFCPGSTGNVAPVTVIAPQLSLTKKVDKDTAGPGEVLTYSLTYDNVGDAEAKSILFLDTIPLYTTYITGSATASPSILIQFSHDGGLNFDSSDAPPVTHILWSGASLLPGSGGAVTFQVTID